MKLRLEHHFINIERGRPTRPPAAADTSVLATAAAGHSTPAASLAHRSLCIHCRVLNTYKIVPGVRRVYIFVEKESNTNERFITFLQLFTTCSI